MPALAVPAVLAGCSAAEERAGPDAEAPASASDAAPGDGVVDGPLETALARLDDVLLMHLDPALAWDMDPALEAAGEAIAETCLDPTLSEPCEAARATLDTLVVWHGVIAGTARVDGAGRAALEQALLASLGAVGGRVPQTEMMAATILLESQRAGEAAERLRELFETDGIAYAPAHVLARTWRDAFPDPLALVPALVTEDADGDAAGEAAYRGDAAAATAGLLHLAAGLAAAADGDESRAFTLYEAGAGHLHAARGHDPLASEWDLAGWRADCLVNAGWLYFAAAQRALDDGDSEGARPYLEAAEADFSEAYTALPSDADARRGIALTGDLYYQAGDLDGIRDYFGRAARRFDDPEWWNNHAFFCRETERYEESYAAYLRCIELAPDNARWVNDTGLILLYHLNRDLDRAEELFRQALELGRKVTENPFATEEAVEENFLAYTDAMLNLGRLWFERGELDEAAEIVGELLELSPGRPDARELQRAIESAREPEGEGADASDAPPDAVPESEPEG